MNKVLSVMCALVVSLAFAEPVISDVKVTSLPPWGVAIDYNLSGVEDEGGIYVSIVEAIEGSCTNRAKSLSGDFNWTNGAHRIYWNMAKDGITSKTTNGTIRISGLSLFCIIDLSAGENAESYPVTYLIAEPSGGFNTTEYKTTKLVLKCVDAGTFTMGDSNDDDNQPHTVTLTKPFYMGLFEVTQKQWELVMGSNPSYFSGDTKPVEYVSYNRIRGSFEGAKWPATNSVDATSFLGKLRDRTKLDFDLPTEAQWEYVCRAGTTTTYSYGDSANGDYMWYLDNSSSASHEVGTKEANPWGFYDMHGNVWEWCLDWYASSLSGGEDPVGSSSGSYRVCRGGSWSYDASYCTSSYRNGSFPSNENYDLGFRISRTLSTSGR